jgi:hypothetical protein
VTELREVVARLGHEEGGDSRILTSVSTNERSKVPTRKDVVPPMGRRARKEGRANVNLRSFQRKFIRENLLFDESE